MVSQTLAGVFGWVANPNQNDLSKFSLDIATWSLVPSSDHVYFREHEAEVEMAECRFCGEQVAWFSKEHEECLQQHNRALSAVGRLITGHLDTARSARWLHNQAVAAARRGHLTVGELRNAAKSAIEDLARKASADHPAALSDANRIMAAAQAFGLDLKECGSAAITLGKSAASSSDGSS